MESYVDLYLEEEIRQESLVRNVGAFQQFLETYPQKARRGFIVCRCREPRRLAENIEAIP